MRDKNKVKKRGKKTKLKRRHRNKRKKAGTKNQIEKEMKEQNKGEKEKKDRGQFSSQPLSSHIQNAPEMHHRVLSQMNI